jgi:ribosomal protein L31E
LEDLQAVLDPELNEEIVKRGEEFPIDGKPAPTPTFQKTFDEMGEDARRKILGPGRLKLYNDGKITLKDLVDQQGRTLTLAELTKKYGGDISKAPRPKSPQVQKFVPSKTIKQAESWALKNKVAKHVDYKGFSVDLANEFNEEIYKLKEEQGFKPFNYVGRQTGWLHYAGRPVEKGEKGQSGRFLMKVVGSQERGSVLLVNASRMTKDKTLFERMDRKGMTRQIDRRGAILHELGHWVDFEKGRSTRDALGRIKAEKLGDTTFEGREKIESKALKDARDIIGTYAFTKNIEFFAESYRMYKQGLLPQELNWIAEFMRKEGL